MAVDEERVESARMVSRADLAADPWRAFGAVFTELWPVFDECAHRFDGLLAVLSGKRPRPGPGKLCIDGREYHRRQRRRVKRRK